MKRVTIVGTESLGVRGLSCYIEEKDVRILIDSGIALGFTRWGLHPHPVQAVAGALIREKLKEMWSSADCIVFTHMHGDHVPLYNANPFQLNLYDLNHDENKKVLAPPMNLLNMKEKIRLQKIHEIYRERLITVKGNDFKVGPLRIYGPYPHGLSRTPVYAVSVSTNLQVLHTSDTGLLVDDIVELAKELKPDIIIADGPPIYRYLHDRKLVKEMLRRAYNNLSRMAKYSNMVIVDHHVYRCDDGYKWVENVRKEYNIMNAAEYMGRKPLLLEAWRRTLYTVFPINNDWFRRDYKVTIEKFRNIYDEIVKYSNKINEVCEEKFLLLLIQHYSSTKMK